MDKKTAIIYARVSTASQAAEELPIQSQIDNCRRKAEELGASVVRVYKDEGISGRTDMREQFQAAMNYAVSFGPAYFITWSSSRFARNMTDAAVHKRQLDNADVELVYCHMNIDRGTDSGWILDHVMSLMDEYYSRSTSADTTRSMARNAERGYWNGGKPPFGYMVAADPGETKRKRLVINESEAPLVRMMFQLRNSGVGAQAIAYQFNNKGLTRRGKRWNKNAVSYILRSESVIGRTVFGRRDTKNKKLRPKEEWIVVQSHQPIIPESEWLSVQDAIDEDAPIHGGSPQSEYLFTGMLTCGECGAAMQTESAKGRDRRYHYYNCRESKLNKTHPPVRVPAHEFDEYVREKIIQEALDGENMLACAKDIAGEVQLHNAERTDKAKVLKRERDKSARAMAAIYDAIETGESTTHDVSLFVARLKEHRGRINAIDDEYATIMSNAEIEVPVEELQKVAGAFLEVIRRTESKKKLRAFFSGFVQKVTVYDSSAKIEYSPRMLVQAGTNDLVPARGNWLRLLGSNQRPND